MRTKFMIAAVLLVFIDLPAASVAADQWYIGGRGGLSILNESDIQGGGTKGEADFDAGFLIGGAVGYAFTQPFRVEGEIVYRKNAYDTIETRGLGETNAGGDYSSLALMVNGAYDFKYWKSFVPYLIGGIGTANIDTDATRGVGVSIPNDSDWVFAYQVGVGVGIPFAKHWVFDLSYRFLGTTKPEFSSTRYRSEMEYWNHNVIIGITYKF